MAQRRRKGAGNIGRRKEDGLWYGRLDLVRDASPSGAVAPSTAGRAKMRRRSSRHCSTRKGAACRSRRAGRRSAIISPSDWSRAWH